MKAQNGKENSEKPRRPGRPRGKQAGADNREQLMDLALALFARQGIARVSLNAIAKEAGVTPAMLHYYFNSREALIDQILEERFMPLRNRINDHGAGVGGTGRAKHLVRAAVDAGDDW
jgi:AcrR family transcriptional regulator